MRPDNVDLVRQGFEALSAGGADALVPLVGPEFEITIPPELSLEPATYRGAEGLRRYFESFYEAVDEVRFEPEEFIAVGDCVVVPTRVVVRGRESGAEAGQRVVQVWRLRDGRAIAVEPFGSLDEAIAAAGPPGEGDIEVVAGLFAAWRELAERDLPAREREAIQALADRLHPDAEYREDPAWPGAGVHRGRDAVVARFAEYWQVMDMEPPALEEVAAGTHEVVAVYLLRGRGTGSGSPFTQRIAWLIRVRGGLIWRLTARFDADAARREAGSAGPKVGR
jgi:ketosteroid isomerase-like protein